MKKYYAEKSIWGSSNKKVLEFNSKKERDDYVNKTDYTNKISYKEKNSRH